MKRLYLVLPAGATVVTTVIVISVIVCGLALPAAAAPLAAPTPGQATTPIVVPSPTGVPAGPATAAPAVPPTATASAPQPAQTAVVPPVRATPPAGATITRTIPTVPTSGATRQGPLTLTGTLTTSVTPALPARVASFTDLQAAVAQVYQAVNPSVVHIWASVSMRDLLKMLPGGSDTPDDNQAQAGSRQPAPLIKQSQGSGFVWDTDGHIVTNNHVVEGSGRLWVTFVDGRMVPATLVGSDPRSDLAVLKVDQRGLQLHPVTIADSTEVQVGQFAVAIGNPFGLRGTMTFGIVSGLGRVLPVTPDANSPLGAEGEIIPDIIQMDTPVNPGNSGGVLVDMQGRCIGVTAAREPDSNNIGYAVPSIIVKRVVPALIETGSYAHPWIGLHSTPMMPEIARAMDLDEAQTGALVMDVTAGGPADHAGLHGSSRRVTIDQEDWLVGGDVVIGIEDQPITWPEEIETYLVRHANAGQLVKLTVLRAGKRIAIPVEVGSEPERGGTQQAIVPGNAWLGINGVSLSAELARAMNLPADTRGVLIENVVNAGPADQAGLKGGYKTHAVNGEWITIGGDVITAISGQTVNSMEDLTRLVEGMKPGRAVTFTILRDGKEMAVVVTPSGRPDSTL